MSADFDNNRKWDALYQRVLRNQRQLDEMMRRCSPAWGVAQLEAHFMAMAPLEASVERDLAEMAALNAEYEASVA